MMASVSYPTILFDWGDTVMKDDPASTIPMVEWESVEVIPGIDAVLQYLQSSGRRMALATSASISDESQIRAALGRAGLGQYFSRIFCFKNTGLPKGEAFYHHILDRLKIPASDALMVGDSLEKDVLDANRVGIYAIWFHSDADITQTSESYATIHSMEKLLLFFKALDR